MSKLKFQLGDKVIANGPMYMSASGTLIKKTVKNQVSVITKVAEKGIHQYVLDNVFGWFDEKSLKPFVEISVKVGDRVRLLKPVSYNGQRFTLTRNSFTLLSLDGDKAVIGHNGVPSYTVNAFNLEQIK